MQVPYVLTPSSGKRLIAKAVADKLSQTAAIKTGVIVIVAGTTNGYVAEELLKSLNQSDSFVRKRFFRGITTPPGIKTTDSGRLPDESAFPGDVVIQEGIWLKGKTIFDVLEELNEGDIIVKGANCVDIVNKKAGILIGHPKGGTIVAALQAIVGRRVKLILPVGLEKRVSDSIDSIAAILNSPGCTGPRLLPINGDIITEIEALEHLSETHVRLIAAGGVCGAEGAVWITIQGNKENVGTAKAVLDSVANEEAFAL
jgi:hypothetical protein